MNDKNNDVEQTILVVDDEAPVLDLFSRILAQTSCNVVTTESVEEAIRLVADREIALLVCDLHIASADDGTSVIAAARAANPDTISILVSGNINSDAMITALNEGGIWKCLEKPIEPDEILALAREGVRIYANKQKTQKWLRDIARGVVNDSARDTVAVSRTTSKLIHKKGASSPFPSAQPEVIGTRYRVLGTIGDGGLGTVYRVEDALLGTVFAAKVLSSELASDEDAITTLKDEARIAMGLSHRNIVRLFNFEQTAKTCYLIMEFVDGCSLRDVFAHQSELSHDTVRFIARSCADGLTFAHHNGIVHGDLKPENLMISQEGLLKIIDFGVACLIHAPRESRYITGTPAYMSPEQKKGEPIDLRTDVYAMGMILYETLVGRTPFSDELSHMAILKADPDPLVGLSSGLTRVLERAIAIDREERWPSMKQFIDEFMQELEVDQSL